MVIYIHVHIPDAGQEYMSSVFYRVDQHTQFSGGKFCLLLRAVRVIGHEPSTSPAGHSYVHTYYTLRSRTLVREGIRLNYDISLDPGLRQRLAIQTDLDINTTWNEEDYPRIQDHMVC